MIIDFTEIPQANRGGGKQDAFELFSRDFIELLGYQIVSGPARGADGGLDFKVKELRVTQNGNQNIFWLASCKHYAHSGVGISPDIESDILDRVVSNGCQGFMGIYSTIPTNGLVNKLQGLAANGQIEQQVFDRAKIEGRIVGISSLEHLFVRYFPDSYKKWVETYYFKEPVKLFESYFNSKYKESVRTVLLAAFHSVGNLIKAIRKHDSIEGALGEHGVKLIVDPEFYPYNHRKEVSYISDVKPFQVQTGNKNSFNYVLKHDDRVLNAYLRGCILPKKGFGLVKTDEKFIYEKVKYRYGINLPPNSYLYAIVSFQPDSTLHLFTSLMIVNNGHYRLLNDVFDHLKQMLD